MHIHQLPLALRVAAVAEVLLIALVVRLAARLWRTRPRQRPRRPRRGWPVGKPFRPPPGSRR
jgi:hypothetical protein